MKDARPNAARFLEAFDFASLAEIQMEARKTLSLSAFRFCRPRGTGDALSRWMRKRNEKPNRQSGALRVITAETFTADVLSSKQPVLVGFSTSWSRPCQVLDSVLQELDGHWGGKVKIVKVNADDSLDLSLCYDIHSVPTLLCFVAGSPCFRIVGTATREAVAAKINLLVGKHQAAAS
jgi:thioredoxin 1